MTKRHAIASPELHRSDITASVIVPIASGQGGECSLPSRFLKAIDGPADGCLKKYFYFITPRRSIAIRGPIVKRNDTFPQATSEKLLLQTILSIWPYPQTGREDFQISGNCISQDYIVYPHPSVTGQRIIHGRVALTIMAHIVPIAALER